jgi:hypothetical protein
MYLAGPASSDAEALGRYARKEVGTVSLEITNFRSGNLDAIQVGAGLGNSMADLRLSYKGWMFGQRASEGQFSTGQESGHWIRTELGGGR